MDEATSGGTPIPGDQLIAYRLGRVEKAVDQINLHSIERDEKILEKLEQIGEVAQKVSQNTWRIQSLEESRTRIYQFIAGLASAVVILVIQIVFKLI